MMMKSDILIDSLNKMIPNPKCELEYKKDYELLIATVLSAQCKDKTVNEVTKVLFRKYDIYGLKDANLKDIEKIIKPVGTFRKKSIFIKEIANRLCNDFNGSVPNNRQYLESLPGVGRKTCNLVLSNIYNVPAIAVDTHVKRVSNRLGIANDNDTVFDIEKKLMKLLPKEVWGRTHHQLVLFGRYICTSKKPNCDKCLLKKYCKYFRSQSTFE